MTRDDVNSYFQSAANHVNATTAAAYFTVTKLFFKSQKLLELATLKFTAK